MKRYYCSVSFGEYIEAESREEAIEKAREMMANDSQKCTVLCYLSQLKEYPSDVLKRWNAIAKEHGLPCIRDMRGNRWKQYLTRVRENPDFWGVIESEVPKLNGFAHGHNNGGWKLTFQFLIESPVNWAKFAEGNYRGDGVRARMKAGDGSGTFDAFDNGKEL